MIINKKKMLFLLLIFFAIILTSFSIAKYFKNDSVSNVKIKSIFSNVENGRYGRNCYIDINIRFESPVMMKSGKLKIYLNVGQDVIIDKFELTDVVSGTYIVENGDMIDALDVIKIKPVDGELVNINHQKISLVKDKVSLIDNNQIIIDSSPPSIDSKIKKKWLFH